MKKVGAKMKKLNFIGIGGATNIELGGNSCYLKDDDNLLVIDMCEGATERLEKEDVFKGVKNIYVIITHTHFDHVAGLGVFIWYCNFYLNISPKIIYSKFKYKNHIKKLLRLTDVDKKYFEFIKSLYSFRFYCWRGCDLLVLGSFDASGYNWRI